MSRLPFRGPAIVVVCLFLRCGPGSQAARSVDPSAFAPYAGRSVELFDDKIDPTAVGLADVNVNPRTDPILHDRVNEAEAVAKMRVSTVTVETIQGQPLYHVSLVLAGTLVSRGFSDERLDLSIGPSSPSFGVVKWLDTRLIGRTFIGFVRRFSISGAEEPVLRFHLSPDSPDVLTAIREATALGDLKAR